ncbi:ferric reductase NAD binding domain-containing protein, partial [Flammula alnicola]
YPKQIIYLLASFTALVSLCHFLSLGYRYATRNRVYAAKKKTAISLRRLPAAVADSARAVTFRWTLALGSSYTLNLAGVFLTLGYIAVLLTWTFVNSTTVAGVKVDPGYYANRAGNIATSQMPILVALGMRNNPISWLTGVSYDRINFLHRLLARVICILSWIHGGGRVRNDSVTKTWMQAGILASTSISLMLILTIRPVRERSYELFLLAHFTFAFIFVLGTYFHVASRRMAYFGVWPSMMIWGLERFFRLVRLAVYNFGYLNPRSSETSRKSLDASVEVLSNQSLRVTIHRPKIFHWRPGQTAFLAFPTVSKSPFESHPFTMSTIDDDPTSNQKKLVFIIRVRKGFTQRLSRVASPDQTYKVFINGPYSSPPILMGYQTVILIAGGSGVAFTLSLLSDLISRAKRNEHACERVVFVWALRHLEHVQWIEDHLSALLKDVPSSISVDIKIYVTSPAPPTEEKWDDDSNGNGSKESLDGSDSLQSEPNLLESPYVSLGHGRPDVSSLISDEVASATGSISVNVCGTHSLAEAVRKATRNPRPMDILRGGPTVTLHVEAFGSRVSRSFQKKTQYLNMANLL